MSAGLAMPFSKQGPPEQIAKMQEDIGKGASCGRCNRYLGSTHFVCNCGNRDCGTPSCRAAHRDKCPEAEDIGPCIGCQRVWSGWDYHICRMCQATLCSRCKEEHRQNCHQRIHPDNAMVLAELSTLQAKIDAGTPGPVHFSEALLDAGDALFENWMGQSTFPLPQLIQFPQTASRQRIVFRTTGWRILPIEMFEHQT